MREKFGGISATHTRKYLEIPRLQFLAKYNRKKSEDTYLDESLVRIFEVSSYGTD